MVGILVFFEPQRLAVEGAIQVGEFVLEPLTVGVVLAPVVADITFARSSRRRRRRSGPKMRRPMKSSSSSRIGSSLIWSARGCPAISAATRPRVARSFRSAVRQPRSWPPFGTYRSSRSIYYPDWKWDDAGYIYSCSTACIEPRYHRWDHAISSVYNRLPDVVWGRFFDDVHFEFYGAYQGAPASYVGDYWNDHFLYAHAW
jgi:hypothetical protein